MMNLTETAIRLYQRLFGSPDLAGVIEDGIETVLDGNSAVAITEAGISDSASLGGSFPAGSAGLAWLSEQQHLGRNYYKRPLASHNAEDARGSLATAMGLAMSGQRTTAFLSGQDLAACQDLLVSAAGQRLPLVLHIATRALSSQGIPAGSGHEALHMAADSGCIILIANDVQQAVDFSLIARRVAETTLTPALVVMDGEETALAAQNVKLSSAALARRFLGPADEQLTVTDAAQKLLFGEQRLRVPRWHDLDRPVLQGAMQGGESYALGRSAQAAYFSGRVADVLEEAFSEFAHLSGRRYHALSNDNLDKAQHLLVVQGAAYETVRTVVRHLRKTRKMKLGVVGLHTLRPTPVEALRGALRGKATVTVLERLDAPLAGDLPLTRELRAALGQVENAAQDKLPAIRSVVYGLGGLPLRGADLITLCEELETSTVPCRYLGIDFHSKDSRHPKRQVMLDTLRRSYPGIAELGLSSNKPAPDLRPHNALSIAIHHLTGQGNEALGVEAAALLHRVNGAAVRHRPELSWKRWGDYCVDRLLQAPQASHDPGSDLPIDIALLSTGAAHPDSVRRLELRHGGILLLSTDTTAGQSPSALPEPLRAAIEARELRVYTISHDAEDDFKHAQLLGALCGALLAEERLDAKPRKITAAYRESLSTQDEAARDAQLDAFSAALEGVTRLSLEGSPRAETPMAATATWIDEAPMAVRHLGQTEDTYDSLPRFWDQVGVLYRNGETAALAADPYLAAGAVPPLTATFNDQSPARRMLPQFDPQSCTGCGKCWSLCPDSAIGAAAFTPKVLLDHAIKLAGASSVRQISSKLAARIASLGRKQEAESSTFDNLLDEAFTWLEEKSPLAEERRQAVVDDLYSIKSLYSGLPVTFSEPLFLQAEKEKQESGSLLTLAVNPDSCKGCGICTSACEPGALSAVAQQTDHIASARRLWRNWEQTPDTDSAVIERAAALAEPGPMAAVMLSRFCAFSLSGGDSAEAGSGEKIALRQVLAAAEYQQQPLLSRFIAEVAQLRDAIGDRVKDTLADALPTNDLSALAANLEQAKTREVDLTTLAGGTALEGSGVDVPNLKRLIALAQQLNTLHWQLAEGRHGLGRARFGIAIAPGAATSWAASFPHNPFQAPVTVDITGEAAQLAAGLMQGQLDEAVGALRLLRKARQLLDPRLAKNQPNPDQLGWDELDEDERQLCPPLFLVGSDASLAGHGLAQVSSLLNTDLPLKVVVLSELDLGIADNTALSERPLERLNDARSNLALVALAQRSAYVAQSSFAAPQHLRQSLREALKFTGPALLHIHAPSPQRHGFTSEQTVEIARQAIDCRVHPLFRYHPQGEGVFGSRITLEDNPAEHEAWLDEDEGGPFTPAHWAAYQARFDARLSPLQEDAPAPTDLGDWLAMEPAARRGKTPFITMELGEETQRFAIDTALAEVAAERAQAWRTLQELAGVVTPFTARVAQEAKEQLAATHQAELEALRQEYEAKIRAIEEGHQAAMHARVKSQLMSLAGYDPSLLSGDK